jgi:predicted lipoprotein with Yx(FWY)xxD motif
VNSRLLVGGAIAAVVLGATGVGVALASGNGTGSGPSPYGAPPAATSPSASTGTSSATVMSGKTALGQTLVDGAGRTLYLFESDSATRSTCYGSCASVWPPVSAATTPHTAGTASTALLGMLRRTDGTTQLTYKGHPLYYYAGDAKPADTTGQGLDQFGAKWYVLTPGGDKIDHD